MRNSLGMLAFLTVLASALVTSVLVISAVVSAFHSTVDTDLTVPASLDGLLGSTLFPVEFVVSPMPLALSDSFLAQDVYSTVTVEVWVQCDNADGVKWMGDLAYLAREDPTGVVPGGGDAGPYPPSVSASTPTPHRSPVKVYWDCFAKAVRPR